MVETVSSLVALSGATAQLIERAAGSFVSIRLGAAGIRTEFIGGPALSSQRRAVVRVVSRGGLCLRTRRAYCRELICRHCFLSKQ